MFLHVGIGASMLVQTIEVVGMEVVPPSRPVQGGNEKQIQIFPS